MNVDNVGKPLVILVHVKHERTHNGEKPCVCKWCSKAFRHHSSIQKHEGIHTGKKPDLCKQRGKVFHSPTSLQCHKLILERNPKDVSNVVK